MSKTVKTPFFGTLPLPHNPYKNQKNHLCNIILLKCILILSHQFPFTLLPSTSIPPKKPTPASTLPAGLYAASAANWWPSPALPWRFPPPVVYRPSRGWTNLLMMSPLPLLWCEKKTGSVGNVWFFLNGLLLLSLDRCWFVPKQFLCESVFHTLEENFYIVNSECWIHNNDRFCFETQHAQFLMLSQNMCSELPQSLKSWHWNLAFFKRQKSNASLGQNEKKTPNKQSLNPTNCKIVKLSSSFQMSSKEGCWVDKKRLDHRNGKNSNVMVLNSTQSRTSKKRLATADFKKFEFLWTRRGLDFPKIHVLMCLLRRTVSYSTGKMLMSSNNIPTVE